MGVCRLCAVAGAPSAVAFAALPPLEDALHSAALSARAAQLHPRHRAPYVLSRVAASSALTFVYGAPIAFVGDRSDALRFGARLSIAHEDHVGAAIAWPNGAALVAAVDVVDVAQVARLSSRYSHFAARMLPGCEPFCLSCNAAAGMAAAYRADPATAVMAQHWGLRECCVKLVGIIGRSFSLACVYRPKASFPPVFEARVVGEEAAAMRRAGLQTHLTVTTLPISVDLPNHASKTYAIIMATCETEERGK